MDAQERCPPFAAPQPSDGAALSWPALFRGHFFLDDTAAAHDQHTVELTGQVRPVHHPYHTLAAPRGQDVFRYSGLRSRIEERRGFAQDQNIRALDQGARQIDLLALRRIQPLAGGADLVAEADL